MSGRRAWRITRGFTLLEVLVAIAIFAIIGLGANEMLRTITRTHDRARQITDMLAQLSMAFVVMQRDIGEIVPLGIRDENGELRPPLAVGTGEYFLEFTRTGWNNPTGLARSDLQRVAYQLTDKGVLQRKMWLVLDRSQDSKPVTQVLLTGIKDFRVNLLKDDGTTVNSWPDTGKANQLPVAVEVFVDTKTMGELRRVFALVGNAALPQQPGQQPNGGTNNPGNPSVNPGIPQ